MTSAIGYFPFRFSQTHAAPARTPRTMTVPVFSFIALCSSRTDDVDDPCRFQDGIAAP